MAATLKVYYDFGGVDGTPGTQQDTTSLGPPSLRFKQADNATIDSNNPMPVPSSGTNYSRWKQIYLKCTVAPATKVDNIKFYTDGTSFGTGIVLKVGLQFPTKNSGSNAGYEVADENSEMVAAHGGLTSSANAFNYSSGATLSGPTISEAGNLINLANETTNYLVLQMEVASTAGAGDLTNETSYFRYDEV